jgi:uncharacterized protein YbjT (DUF2867 family)
MPARTWPACTSLANRGWWRPAWIHHPARQHVHAELRGVHPDDRSQGLFALPAGTGRCAFVDCADLAAVAAAVLTQDAHDGRTYLVTGSEALTMDAAAAQLSVAFGRTIRYLDRDLDVPIEDARAALGAQGAPDWVIEQMKGSISAFAAGEVAEVTDVVAGLTDRPPHTFAQFAQTFAEFARGFQPGAPR